MTGNNSEVEAGGGVHATSSVAVIVSRSTISGNETADEGGGIFSNGTTVILTDSTVADNTAITYGGGISRLGEGDLILSRTTVSGNAGNWGAGIYASVGPERYMLIANSTISGNVAGDAGGGMYLEGSSPNVEVVNATISDNDAEFGGGIYLETTGGSVRLSNTIIAEQRVGADCSGSNPNSQGHNLDSDESCSLSQPSDLPDSNAALGPLGSYGGFTQTHALLKESEAINAGNNATCAAPPIGGVDQRGFPRPQGSACDIGAFEFGAEPPPLELLWGDVDCDGAVAIGDALKVARHLLGLTVSQTSQCPGIGSDVEVDGMPRAWGDADCDGNVAIGDALKTARYLLGLSVSQEPGCPEIGSTVKIPE